LIPTVERWLPGAGLDYVRKGYSVYTSVKEISVNEVVPLLNLFVQQKNFNNISNNFVTEVRIIQNLANLKIINDACMTTLEKLQ
jgi:hypothetical protein